MSSTAESFERYVVPGLFAPWASVLLGLPGRDPASGCSTWRAALASLARAAVPMVSPSGWVTGLDLDPANIAVAVRSATGRAGSSGGTSDAPSGCRSGMRPLTWWCASSD